MSWPLVKLKDCCKVIGGATPKRNIPEYWDSNDIPWVTPKDVSKLVDKVLGDAPEYISQLGFDKCATYMLPKGSVLLTSRAPIGNVAIAGKSMCTNQGFKSLVPSENVDSTYLYYCMLVLAPKLEALGNGATFKEVSKKIVEDFEIPLPPLAEQKRIAAILDKADAIRQKRKYAIELADEFLRSVFLDMFGDIPAKVSKYPFVGCRGAVTASSGKSSKNVISDTETDIPIYGGNGINGYAKEPLYDEPVVVVGRVGQQCAITKLTEGPCWVTDNAIVLRITDHSKYDATFLAHALIHSPIRNSVTQLDLPFINQSMILDYPIPLPPIDIQRKFASIRTKVVNHIQLEQETLAKCEEQFNSLSQKAFSGEL